MTYFGTIKSYDSDKGTGTIIAEKAGDQLGFRKSDLQQEAQAPKQNDRYGYDVKEAKDGKRYAVNLAPKQAESQSQREQAQKQSG
ncbi:cold-shock protein [Altererythrobacter arenosus]|uniref:Cold-shock protein n=1 Tax=Altererythrobacter arenosus TaxID=3032592 RepID=A0ABY8FX14_9SPHN|nr:cold-shock protein [Altererythrobacter sp. CAU 1644]WFL76564.1 cold-shock protein [Altererythrobacter sp. CAU 1644]